VRQILRRDARAVIADNDLAVLDDDAYQGVKR